ncbi:MAG TPA: DUF58 domain-containing protein [Longimicrobiales bacterium]|nr:DUF58 domain-containing protein [Longimicrobiales bacterium]
MTLLPASLLQKLGRTRLNPLRAVASTGVGERRSRALGSGLEFADHRAYEFGDDTRHLDPHLYARLGRPYIRQYIAGQQLSVTVLIDASASMAFGSPTKLWMASALAAGLAYAGLAGGDRVLVGAFSGGRVHWHPRIQGTRAVPALLAWLERLRGAGTTDLRREVRASLARMGSTEGMTFLISDWFVDGVGDALAALRSASQEVVAVQVLAPEELEPERLGEGEVLLLDSESPNEVEVHLDAGAHARYRLALDEWRSELRASILGRQGRYLAVRSDDDVERVLARDWRLAGLVG